MPKFFVAELFCAVFRKISAIEENGIREVEDQDYPSIFIGLSLPKNSVGESSKAALI